MQASQSPAPEELDSILEISTWEVLPTEAECQSQLQFLERLEGELIKDGAFDPFEEKKIAYGLLKLILIDEVSERAIKDLGLFVSRKVQDPNVLSDIADQLYDLFITGEKGATIMSAMKTVITELPPVDYVNLDKKSRACVMAVRLVECWAPRITGGISKKNVVDSLTLMAMLLRNFGFIIRNHSKFKNIHFWGEYFCTGIELGKGSYANVFLGRHIKTAKVVAIKMMDWDRLTNGRPKLCEQLQNEIDIMKEAKHPNIVGLYDVVREGCNLNLILEYCGGGSMEEYLQKRGPLGEEEVRHWLKELALGLKFLHEKNIIHRDLKPGNLLLSAESPDSQLKITDFTFARFMEPGNLATTLVGTPLYMAPEIFLDRKYTEKSDLWSVGVILYQMLTGKVPYRGYNVMELVSNIQMKELEWPPILDISPDMKDLLRNLLQKNPDLRITWTEFFLHKCLGLDGSLSATVHFTNSELQEIKDRELQDALREIEELKQQLAESEDRAAKAEGKIQAYENVASVIRGETAKQLREKDEQTAKLKDQNDELRCLVERLEAENRELKERNEAQEARHDDVAKEYEQRIAAAEAEAQEMYNKAQVRSETEGLNKEKLEQLQKAHQARLSELQEVIETFLKDDEEKQKAEAEKKAKRKAKLRRLQFLLEEKDAEVDEQKRVIEDKERELEVYRIALHAEAQERGMDGSLWSRLLPRSKKEKDGRE